MKLCLATLVRKMASLENSDQRYKVIDRGDLAKFLREDMIDQLRGEERVCRQLIRAFERKVYFLCF